MIDYKITKSVKRRDYRGFLVDFLKLDELEGRDRKLGQIYCVTFDKKGIVRGNHYHTKKKEWFVAIKGKLRVVLFSNRTNETVEFILDGDNDDYERIYIGPNISHAFECLTKDAVMINYCNKPYHPEDPDTYPKQLIKINKK